MEQPPEITFDPATWLVYADWVDEYHKVNAQNNLAAEWRWRGRVAQMIKLSLNDEGAWTPHDPCTGDPHYFVCNEKLIFSIDFRSSTIRLRFYRPFLIEPGLRVLDKSLIWRLEFPHTVGGKLIRPKTQDELSAYYRKRTWELADTLFAMMEEDNGR